jgi:glucoamylase
MRFGIRKATDASMATSIPIVDSTIRVDLPGIGPGFYRYNHDRYNYDELNNGAQTNGMLWPLLTGERGHYELEKSLESGRGISGADEAVDPYIATMEAMATSEHFIPEQVWDGGPRAGQSTGSATPLGWSHAEYLKLLRSRSDRQVFDRVTQAN